MVLGGMRCSGDRAKFMLGEVGRRLAVGGDLSKSFGITPKSRGAGDLLCEIADFHDSGLICGRRFY